ncbi:MAG: 2-amino-4-hydroxy-6-hydroxymethyldihydropteridine diphosphokinase [Acidobacteria bacterium]|nr:2-amino-4-hydroxy-6-hydroxymethyldihydropteridine diphosphokinase [Acidobacteriota bacterium]
MKIAVFSVIGDLTGSAAKAFRSIVDSSNQAASRQPSAASRIVSSGGVRPVAVALGSNLGDRRAALDRAAARLAEFLTDLRVSPVFETAPVGVSPQPDFLNAAAVGLSTAAPRQVLDRLLAIEAELGRERPFPGAPRRIDLDLILCGDEVIEAPGLCVPHPRFRERRFVLEPLAAIGPDLRDPVTGRTVAELLAALDATQVSARPRS